MAGLLAYRETESLLRRLGDVASSVVLVGGQAVNFWAERYLGVVPELAEGLPYASKDIDLCGSQADAKRIAEQLGATLTQAEPFEPSLNVAVIMAPGSDGGLIRIDMLREPFGLKSAEVVAMGIPVVIADQAGIEQRFRVMHPVLSMESRAFNTALLPGYARPEGLKQLRASVLCAREFLREILRDGHDRDVLRLNERIFRFRLHDEAARMVLERHAIDVFEAVLDDPALPEAFRSVRLPQMRAALAAGG